jgi:predicted HTH transcriptional regulator
MSDTIKNISIEGNHNIVLTEVNGSTITLSLSELFEQYATQLDEILVLLKNKQEASYVSLVKEIQEYKNSHYRSELDGFNLYLEQSKNNQAAASSQPIIGKTVADLDKRHLKTLFALARVKEHFKQYKVNTKASTEEKLRSLRLMTNGYVIKGTFLCLANYTNFGFMGGFVDEASFGAFDTLDKIIIKKSEHPLGNIIEQYHTLFEYITGELSPQIMVDIKNREWDYAIPKVVIQELLANALIHRSYENTVRRPVTIDIYPDRIVIENPGYIS